jgi:aminoglycoside phosphotransferase (APT) family kinase protein
VSGDFQIGPVPDRLVVGTALVERLVADQFPGWAGLPVRAVEQPGWDNFTFRIGDDLVARLPSAEPYALAVGKEQHWLPRLAPRLPLPIPSLLGAGRPGPGYPLLWSVFGWLPGRPATGADPAFAVALADFLLALRQVDPAEAPVPGRTTGSVVAAAGRPGR